MTKNSVFARKWQKSAKSSPPAPPKKAVFAPKMAKIRVKIHLLKRCNTQKINKLT